MNDFGSGTESESMSVCWAEMVNEKSMHVNSVYNFPMVFFDFYKYSERNGWFEEYFKVAWN